MYFQKNDGNYTLELEQHCKQLEIERNKILLVDEENWRQKSGATWIKSGDKNTKFFQRFASYRRNKKYLWDITDDSGSVHFRHEAIKDEVFSYFKTFFKEPR